MDQVYRVSKVYVTNRMDCCSNRFSRVEVCCFERMDAFKQKFITIFNSGSVLIQVRVGPTDVSSLPKAPFTVNTACGSPKHRSNHVDMVYQYQCPALLEGNYVTVQKLGTSQSGMDKSLAVNEVEIFHQGKKSCWEIDLKHFKIKDDY